MMGGMSGGLWIIGLLWLSIVLGFAYIICIMAMKESGKVKLIGQVIGLVIVVLAIVLFIGSLFVGGSMAGKHGGKDGMMMDQDQMNKMMEMQKGMPKK
ncbi:MAG: hypothetical protein HQ564_03200 [Candidatus Saganbacteria bacterium]|nr:hypothetical protein [Candidatus Saganbacteria bacterium]